MEGLTGIESAQVSFKMFAKLTLNRLVILSATWHMPSQQKASQVKRNNGALWTE